jgi:hypothetical protein
MATPLTPEALADYFVRYLFEEYHGTRHVRRIASWVGFVVKGIERVLRAPPFSPDQVRLPWTAIQGA